MNLEGLKGVAESINQEFFNSNPDARSVNDNWVIVKTSLATAVDTVIP